jgi:hypothetical protein
MSDQGEANPSLAELLSALESGNFSSIVPIVSLFADSDGDSSILTSLASSLISILRPGATLPLSSGVDLFITASLAYRAVFTILGPLFFRPEHRDFSNLATNLIAANFLSDPDHLSQILLFVASRAAQSDPQFYAYALAAVYSAVSSKSSSPAFPLAAPAFARLVDFEPDATSAPLSSVMRSAFLHLARMIRDGSFISFAFVHTLRFWSTLACRAQPTADAFVQIARRSLTHDKSLKANPFRLRVIRVLMDCGVWLPCLAPLARICAKAMHDRANSQAEFDWDIILVADKDVARSKEYQQRLFAVGFGDLSECVARLARRVAFPEMVAPVVRALAQIPENEAFEEQAADVKKLLARIQKNAKWVEEQREALAVDEAFDVTTVCELRGAAPLQK